MLGAGTERWTADAHVPASRENLPRNESHFRAPEGKPQLNASERGEECGKPREERASTAESSKEETVYASGNLNPRTLIALKSQISPAREIPFFTPVEDELTC